MGRDRTKGTCRVTHLYDEHLSALAFLIPLFYYPCLFYYSWLQYSTTNITATITTTAPHPRMGDTFPHSLNCMDLRLFHMETATVTITQMMQELGRLCRYVDQSETINEPFALVGGKLYRILIEHMSTCASFTAI